MALPFTSSFHFQSQICCSQINYELFQHSCLGAQHSYSKMCNNHVIPQMCLHFRLQPGIWTVTVAWIKPLHSCLHPALDSINRFTSVQTLHTSFSPYINQSLKDCSVHSHFTLQPGIFSLHQSMPQRKFAVHSHFTLQPGIFSLHQSMPQRKFAVHSHFTLQPGISILHQSMPWRLLVVHSHFTLQPGIFICCSQSV